MAKIGSTFSIQKLLLLLFFSGLYFWTSIALGQSHLKNRPEFEKSTTNLRDKRYCEVLYGVRNWFYLEIKVFNTQGLNLCPENQWKTLSKESIAESTGASFVLLNGPRYWTMDEIEAAGSTVNNVKESFGGLEMNLRAVVELGLFKQLIGSRQYSPNEITRTTNFIYKAGSPIYELTSPDGKIYVMQSYSQIVNENLMMKDLLTLDRQLKLPIGWTYKTRVLENELSLIANGTAYVLQDNLSNSYQRR